MGIARPVPTSARGGSVTAVSSPAKPPNSLVSAVLAVLGATALVLSLATDFPLWLSAAVIAGSVAGVAAWSFAARWRLLTRLLTTGLSATCAAVLFAFAAEGVRGALTDDTPSTHRYFVVEQVYPRTAPNADAGEASGIGLLDPGDTVDVVCLRGGSWAKLDEGSWVPEHAVQAEVDAEPRAPDC